MGRWRSGLKGLRSLWQRQRVKISVVVVAAVGAAVLVVLFFKSLLDNDQGHLSQAIQATASLALIGITGAYVFLTSRIVRVQQIAVRRPGQEQAVRNLLEVLASHYDELRRLARKFPIQPTASQNEIDGISTGVLDSLDRELWRIAFQLPPDIGTATVAVLLAVVRATNRILLLHVASKLEAGYALTEKRVWSKEGLIRAYNADARPEALDRPEWEEISDGRILRGLPTQVDDLMERGRKFLNTM